MQLIKKSNIKDILKKTSVHLPVLIILFIALSTGIFGINFGPHWDEGAIIKTVTMSIEYGTILPDQYVYPSMLYNLINLSILPDVLHNYENSDRTKMLKEFFPYTWGRSYLSNSYITRSNLADISKSEHFKIRTRILFMFIAYFSVLFVYILVLTWRKSWIEALLASSLIGLSWEVAYQSKWVGPDAILMQFGALTMMCIFLAINNKKNEFWLMMAAIAAGLGFGSKYPGAILLIPVLTAGFYNFNGNSFKAQIYLFCKILLFFILAYLVSTPGTIFQFKDFIKDTSTDFLDYGIRGNESFTIAPGLTHLFKMLMYFCMAVFSKYSAISCVFFFLTVMGAFSLIMKEKKIAVILLCFPVLYVLSFSRLIVMKVRNLMVLIPFFAILASIGYTFLCDKIKYPFFRRSFSVLISVLLLINAGWLVYSSYSIRMEDKTNYIEQLSHYLDQRPDILFLLSEHVANDLLAYDKKNRSNVTLNYSHNVKAACLYAFDIPIAELKANQYNYTWEWFGPYDVNYNYYPSWIGHNRIVVMPVNKN